MQSLGETLGLSPEYLKQAKMGRNGGTWAHPKLRGHSGHPENERADVLAQRAAQGERIERYSRA